MQFLLGVRFSNNTIIITSLSSHVPCCPVSQINRTPGTIHAASYLRRRTLNVSEPSINILPTSSSFVFHPFSTARVSRFQRWNIKDGCTATLPTPSLPPGRVISRSKSENKRVRWYEIIREETFFSLGIRFPRSPFLINSTLPPLFIDRVIDLDRRTGRCKRVSSEEYRSVSPIKL